MPPAASPDDDIDRLETALDALATRLEPLADASTVDGFLAALLVVPSPPGEARWLPYVLDAEARPAAASDPVQAVRAICRGRHAQLRRAIGARDWFDPWIFETEGDVAAACEPWAAGFASAWERFAPAAGEREESDVDEALALVYRHLDADEIDLGDVGGRRVQAAIDALAPPADLADAVEQLVRATLLLADASGRPRRVT